MTFYYRYGFHLFVVVSLLTPTLRDVHIYRLVCERTVEENILKKANQKRLLGTVEIFPC